VISWGGVAPMSELADALLKVITLTREYRETYPNHECRSLERALSTMSSLLLDLDAVGQGPKKWQSEG
jgi:hypothetical protein